ncbi:hypothetical protein [Vreelandella neptunia]|uniref:Uncharacterized protein n=1 Tax=Vreelandella neptunia TaxID=115551 RepID=A0ABS9S1R4_9GAMM|nr:hypothetical protein [Halomonas neptunia]MCH4810040.1 hypothetical protein [Halomonas neptunia]
MLIKAVMLMLALCFASVANAEQPFDTSDNWLTQAELTVSAEEGACDLTFDTISKELFLAQGGCCKTCSKGKACGNSCISRNYTCHQPKGCACDG